ncbi:MAG: hypothetical protein H6831_12075 [Planctomycetes bacterium]|nr:hypothetical protein [Planctomycetota bacterium]MCB9905139.1 hypothetical protein [Planctomycetota bacterium]
MRVHLSNLALAITALSASCSSHEESVEPDANAVRVDYLRVEELLPGEDGVTYAHFERSSLRYIIDPVASPDAARLLEYATRALDEGREVCALVDRTTVPPRKDPAYFHLPPPLIVGFE